MIATGNHWDFDSLRVHPPPANIGCWTHTTGGLEALPYGGAVGLRRPAQHIIISVAGGDTATVHCQLSTKKALSHLTANTAKSQLRGLAPGVGAMV